MNQNKENENFNQLFGSERLNSTESENVQNKPQTSHLPSHSSEDVFFASGPFYAHLDDLEDDEEDDVELTNSIGTVSSVRLKSPFAEVDTNGRQSNTRCNVVYAEMPPHLSQSLHSNDSRFSSLHNGWENQKSKDSHCVSASTNSGAKLKLKNLLMLGSSHSKMLSSPSPIEMPNSFHCSGQHQSTQTTHNSKHCDLSDKSVSKPSHLRKTPFSPKMNPFNRILSSSQELFSHHKHKFSNHANPTTNSESSIRVIKPTAIRLPFTAASDSFANVNDCVQHCLRPATSAECYDHQPQAQQTIALKPTSAFRQVNTNSSLSSSDKNVFISRCSQHNRSNSLAESFVFTGTLATQPLPPVPPRRSFGHKRFVRPRSSDGRRLWSAQNDQREPNHVSFDQGSLDSIYANCTKDRLVNSEHEPIHMTLEEVRRIAFGGACGSMSCLATDQSPMATTLASSTLACDSVHSGATPKQSSNTNLNKHTKSKLKLAFENILHKTHCIGPNSPGTSKELPDLSLGRGIYRVNTSGRNGENKDSVDSSITSFIPTGYRRINIEDQTVLPHSNTEAERNSVASPFIRRALPPLPPNETTVLQSGQSNSVMVSNVTALNSVQQQSTSASSTTSMIPQLRSQGYRSFLASIGSRNAIPLSSMTPEERQRFLDYATSIERVKNCGWYWGPVCGEMAEKLLETEPCGSFIVRDSSDEHYIFSLTFKLNGVVRHVRIEHDQGNFSFGSLQKYRSNTIVDFIENAVEHSRSGQFLFFLHRQSNVNLEPLLPVRVQLLNPISRFRQVQSLQHNCRFTILKHVRRDKIHQLPLPAYLHTYLDTPYYYSEELANLRESMRPESKKDEEKRRKNFMKTDPRTLMAKMLINRVQIEESLNIVLPSEPEVRETLNEEDNEVTNNTNEGE